MSDFMHVNTMKICICHDSSAVVACAKFQCEFDLFWWTLRLRLNYTNYDIPIFLATMSLPYSETLAPL